MTTNSCTTDSISSIVINNSNQNSYTTNTITNTGPYTWDLYATTANIPPTYQTVPDYLKGIVEDMPDYLKDILKNDEKKETNNNTKMNKLFGKISNSKLKYSMYGLAVQNKDNNFVAFDVKTNKLIDVSGMTFDFNSFYKMPKAIKDIAPGDIIYHMGNPIFVYSINDNNRIVGLDPVEGEERIIVPSVSPFGFEYVSIIINPLKNNQPTEDTPFGNMLPMLMLEGKNDNMLPLLMMMNKEQSIDPMMMMLMMNKDNNDTLETYMLMMMMKSNNEIK